MGMFQQAATQNALSSDSAEKATASQTGGHAEIENTSASSTLLAGLKAASADVTTKVLPYMPTKTKASALHSFM